MAACILLVHDDDYFAGRAVTALEGQGLAVVRSDSVADALDKLNDVSSPDLLITRLRFPPGGSNGLALARMARRKHPHTKSYL